MIHNNNPPPSWWNRVDAIMKGAGVPTRVWAAVAYAESGFQEWKRNTADPHGGSYGLFQLNAGGQGRGLSIPYMLDPINNAQISAPHLAYAVKRCGPDNMTCIALNSGHPVETGVMPNDSTSARFVALQAGLYQKTSGLTEGIAIYDRLTDGQGVPADPGTGGGLAGDIGAGIVSAVGGAIGSLFSAWDQAMIDTKGPPVMAIVGVMMISWGITIAALKTPPGKVAVAAGKTVATRAAMAAAV